MSKLDQIAYVRTGIRLHLSIVDNESAADDIAEGRGEWVKEQDGKKYLDFLQEWTVSCLGHPLLAANEKLFPSHDNFGREQ